MTCFVPLSIVPSCSQGIPGESIRESTSLSNEGNQVGGKGIADIASAIGKHGLLVTKILEEVFSDEVNREPFAEEVKAVESACSKLARSPISDLAAPSEPENKVIADIAAVIRRLFLYLTQGLKKITTALESRIQILEDVRAAQAELDNIKAYKEAPYDSSVFDVEVTLSKKSPAHGMSLWSILVHYGLKKKDDSRPTSEAQLDALISNIKSKEETASSESTRTNQKVTMLNRTRESYISLLSELVMGEAKLMRSIISLI